MTIKTLVAQPVDPPLLEFTNPYTPPWNTQHFCLQTQCKQKSDTWSS